MRCYVIMGVSGCGKTSVGQALAARGLTAFVDGDDLHPPSNVAKMSNAVPLTDEDRAPWLVLVGQALAKSNKPVAIGCSALKRAYRDIIRAHAGEPVFFLHLAAPQEVLQARVDARKGHFMPPALLQSQFDALESLEPDEDGAPIDIDQPFDGVVDDAANLVKELAA